MTGMHQDRLLRNLHAHHIAMTGMRTGIRFGLRGNSCARIRRRHDQRMRTYTGHELPQDEQGQQDTGCSTRGHGCRLSEPRPWLKA